jgi:hypothetical protein
MILYFTNFFHILENNCDQFGKQNVIINVHSNIFCLKRKVFKAMVMLVCETFTFHISKGWNIPCPLGSEDDYAHLDKFYP